MTGIWTKPFSFAMVRSSRMCPCAATHGGILRIAPPVAPVLAAKARRPIEYACLIHLRPVQVPILSCDFGGLRGRPRFESVTGSCRYVARLHVVCSVALALGRYITRRKRIREPPSKLTVADSRRCRKQGRRCRAERRSAHRPLPGAAPPACTYESVSLWGVAL